MLRSVAVVQLYKAAIDLRGSVLGRFKPGGMSIFVVADSDRELCCVSVISCKVDATAALGCGIFEFRGAFAVSVMVRDVC